METSVIIGLLVIAAVWSVYLLPVVFGDRKDGSIGSTDEFDRWSHTMADVQRHTAADLAANHRDVIRSRRRRTFVALVILTTASLGLAWYVNSLAWLLVGLFFVSLVGLYMAVLAQMRQRRAARLKVTHVAERSSDHEEPQVRVIGS
jgi:NADH:ubiquinone oxidoreductase subunit 2 (subunit N)